MARRTDRRAALATVRVFSPERQLQRPIAELERNVERSVDALEADKDEKLRPTEIKVAEYDAQFGELVLYSPAGGTFRVNLPKASLGQAGRRVVFKNATSSAASITVRADGGHTIDGVQVYTLPATAYVARSLVCDGANWWIV